MTIVNTQTGEITETLDKTAARRLTDRIRLLAENVAEQVEKMAGLINEARTGSAWLALGYSSWTAYIADEFGGVLPRLDREPRREFVRELAAQGMSTRAIAPVVGIHHDTVATDLRTVGNPTVDTDEPAEPRRITGLNGKSYTAPRPIDHASLADTAVSEFPDLAYYRDEAPDLEHCWRIADTLRGFDADEQATRLATLRRSIEVARSKRDGTYVPPTYATKSCPTCGQEVK